MDSSSPLLVAVLVAGALSAIAGTLIYGGTGAILGLCFGPFGVVTAALLRVNATLRDGTGQRTATGSAPGEQVSPEPPPVTASGPIFAKDRPDPGRVTCPSCSKQYHAGNSKCVHCGTPRPS